METILITGGTGFIGKQLCNTLRAKGYHTSILSRSTSENPNSYFWDVNKNFVESKAIETSDYIIHLAGAGIAEKRWTKKRKKEIINSRVNSTKLLYNNIVKLNPNLKGFIAASGIGYYGSITTDKIFNENDAVGTDFLSIVCKLWEKELMKFDAINIRTVVLRTGVVLANKAGAFEKMTKPIKLGAGAIIGNGNQYMPWIHINDLCNLYVEAIENNKLHGIYNAVAPEHITNSKLTNAISESLNKKLILPNIPAFALKAIYGKMATILLNGSRVSCEKIAQTGFKFQFPTIKKSLKSFGL